MTDYKTVLKQIIEDIKANPDSWGEVEKCFCKNGIILHPLNGWFPGYLQIGDEIPKKMYIVFNLDSDDNKLVKALTDWYTNYKEQQLLESVAERLK